MPPHSALLPITLELGSSRRQRACASNSVANSRAALPSRVSSTTTKAPPCTPRSTRDGRSVTPGSPENSRSFCPPRPRRRNGANAAHLLSARGFTDTHIPPNEAVAAAYGRIDYTGQWADEESCADCLR
jgi:hypothetical protein